MDGCLASSSLRLLKQKNLNQEADLRQNEQIVTLNNEQKKLERLLIITSNKLHKFDGKEDGLI
jgi:hypothetical protein